MTALVVLALAVCSPPPELSGFEVSSVREHRIAGLPVSLSIRAVDAEGETVEHFCGPVEVTGVSKAVGLERVPLSEPPELVAGKATLEDVYLDGDQVTVSAGEISSAWSPQIRELPGILSILPPVLAVVLAIVLRQAMIALFAGIWLGAIFLYGYNPATAMIRVFDTHLLDAVAKRENTAIILFTMALGGLVGILAKCGGTSALVAVLSRRAQTKRSGLLATWISGVVLFVDDYANCLLVGNTMRPFTDRVLISREKLAYFVDSTAAPVTTVAVISTWVGFQLGLLDDLATASETTSYDLFISVLPYSFYSFFTIAFVLLLAITLRDFGPMLAAERRAATGQLVRPGSRPLMDKEITELDIADGGGPRRWILAVVPIASVIAIVIVGLYISGSKEAPAGAGLREIISSADPYTVLLWAGFGGGLIAAALALGSRVLTFEETVDSWVAGVKAMVIAVLILCLAWTIGDMCRTHLQTGTWVLSHIRPSPHWIPALTFILSAVIALATGSSFSTMAIVIPIAGPMAWTLTADSAGLDPATGEMIRHATVAAVLSGAVFGDHCSPMSDTTIMSSMSAASDHVDHVRTQAPYAFVCAGAALLCGYVPAGFGVSPLLCIPIGLAILVALLLGIGKKT